MLAVAFFHVLIVLFTCGNANPVDKTEGKTNTTLSAPQPGKTLPMDLKKSNITVASEGGAIMSNTPALSLSNIEPAIPMTLGKEISSNKVKARKGAFLNAAEVSEMSGDTHSIVKSNNTSMEDTQHFKYNVTNASKITPTPNELSSSSSKPNVTRVFKPTLLSAEAIAKTDEMNSDPAVEDEDDRNVKINKIHSNAHPGMVMPVVITILVVPMFAVIGYMVWKRGQAAWKNRHYKRMDFLLDGMYND